MAQPNLTDAQVAEKFNELRNQQNTLMQQIASIDNDRHEHNLVLQTLEPMGADRPCYRSVGGVLVTKTAKEVIPELHEEVKNLDVVSAKLNDELKKKEEELQAHITKYKIRVGDQAQAQPQQQQQQQQSSQPTGVLA